MDEVGPGRGRIPRKPWTEGKLRQGLAAFDVSWGALNWRCGRGERPRRWLERHGLPARRRAGGPWLKLVGREGTDAYCRWWTNTSAPRADTVSRPWISDKPGSRAASGVQLTVDAGSARNLAAEPASLSVKRAAAAVSLAAVAYTRNAHLMPAAAIRA